MPNKFIDDESGATAIEYGLIATLISVALIPGLSWMFGWLGWRLSWLSWLIQYGGG